MKKYTTLVSIACSCLMASMASWGMGDSKDPFGGYNRVMFAFNETADVFVMKPIAKGYRAVVPDPVEMAVTRVLGNLGEINTIFNDVLQGKPKQALNDSGRFIINSTLGIGGLFEVANGLGLKKSQGEDFGQTLGHWGVKSGPYLILPLLGPSTLRDTPTRLVDSLLNPINEIGHIPTRNTVFATGLVASRAEFLKAEKLISGDKYIFTREIYLQRRDYLVSDGKLEDTFGSDYGEYGEDESEYEDY